MQTRDFERDAAMRRVRLVRDGDFKSVWPDQFSERYPNAIVANFVDVAARDIASNLAPLPSLACSAGAMRTMTDKTRAEKKNRIGWNYWRQSQLETAMVTGADQYLSYGFLPCWVEPDLDRQTPVMHILDPMGCYYELDRWLNTSRFARVWRADRQELAAQFGDIVATKILYDDQRRPKEGDIEVVLYIDDTNTTMYLPECEGLIVASYAHRLKINGRPACPVRIATRPGLHDKPRGQFDDVLFVQMAHAMIAALTLEAGHKAVQAPIVLPTDVTELNIGPDAILQTDNGEKVGRVAINVPQAAFELTQTLSQEMNQGAGYPNTRLGLPGQANVTGRGISALEGGFDSQISLGQSVLGMLLREATKMCFAMDLAWWPKVSKTIRGTLSGETFEITYRPSKDIDGDVECEVEYGFAAGATPANAIVTLLQLRGDSIIGRDTFRRQLPIPLDIDQQQREIDVEKIEDGMMQGLAAALTSIGQMEAQGLAAQASQLITAAAQIAQGRQKGQPLIELFAQAFPAPQPPPEAAAPPGAPGQPGAPDDSGGAPGQPGEPLAGVGPDGLPQGTAPGQAGMAPGGRPSVADLSAGFTSGGKAAVSDTIMRRQPIP